ncbi:BnaC03g55020D [Brassica napus]|uniref:BnaC03g55020D protein n=1 Tax=Brassica napus TaxID=3708 RepID=A0A078H2I2_BRANA|nr:BnaC03g55020D [Brassica napus]
MVEKVCGKCCLRTLVERIKPFVVRLGVKKEDYQLSSRNLTLCELLYPFPQCVNLRDF